MQNMLMMNYSGTWENFQGMQEADLVPAAKKGNLEAFNQLVIIYQDRIYHLALSILGDEDSAEDATQNTFLNAYRSLPGLRNGSFKNWLFRICTNNCYDELRRRKIHPLQSLEFEDTPEEIPLPDHDLSGSTSLPEKEYERRELAQVVQQALDKLDAEHRAVVVMIDLQEFDYREAAQVLRIPIGTVKSRLARARKRLRFLLSTGNHRVGILN